MDLQTKPVSWGELYFDLVFVLAVGQVAHAVADDPTWAGVGIAAGLFGVLWWTWIGFATLYNRLGAEEPVPQRLMIIAATVPCGAAAVAVHGAATGHPVPFAIALATARVILAVAQAAAGWRLARGRRWAIARGYAVAAVLFGVSTVIPSPWRYLLWAVAVGVESGNLLQTDARSVRRARAQRDMSALAPAHPGGVWNVVLRLALVAGTALLGWLGEPLGPSWFLALAAAWGAGCAALATGGSRGFMVASRQRGAVGTAPVS